MPLQANLLKKALVGTCMQSLKQKSISCSHSNSEFQLEKTVFCGLYRFGKSIVTCYKPFVSHSIRARNGL